MKREQFDHAVRAAAGVLGSSEIIVVGSQAIHAVMGAELPSVAEQSMEVDVVPLQDPDGRLADLVDGSVGEASMFHEQFGFYAQGVSESTAVLPAGWQDRLLRYETPATNGVVAWCLEPHDLWISKAVAAREKDVEFCRALLRQGLVQPSVLDDRVNSLDTDPASRARVRDRITAWARSD